jgi:D-amino-acid oxidase
VINCAGLGAGDIVGGDDALHPVQGSVVKIVPVPELTGGRFLDALGEEEEMAYIIPRSDCYVLGGTALKNVYSVAPPDASVVAGILSRCEQLAPGLSRAARPIVVATGLRPVRTGGLAVGRRSDAWIDNYGFGGSGWTMFFGASLYAARLAHQICAGAPKL